jgi:site-specific DNA-methyltransferase (adenine-specific)
MRSEKERNDSRQNVHFSSATDEWATPDEIFAALAREFDFTLDPCATPENARCGRFFTRAVDGLSQSWSGETVFMNPPYGRKIGEWMRKAYESAALEGATVVCLVPARTDTRWWHTYVMRGEIRLLRGRLCFGNAVSAAPFPSAIVLFRPPSFRLSSFSPEEGLGIELPNVLTKEGSPSLSR